jgi:hypothetical protein
MSLLAAAGIGIFDRDHVVVDSTGTCQLLTTRSTHQIAWLALQQWATFNNATATIGQTIRPDDLPLQDWLSAFDTASQLTFIGASWLEEWGLDLQRLTDDREARNVASYRPTFFNQQTSLDVIRASTFLRNLWAVFEPSGLTRFKSLDAFLLRGSLEQSFHALTGKAPAHDLAAYTERAEKCLAALGYATPIAQSWVEFLVRRSQPSDPAIITMAQQTAGVTSTDHHLQVMARAALLLRLATGMSTDLAHRAGFTGGDLGGWWSAIGLQRGFWEAPDQPTPLTELWGDVAVALEDLELWEGLNPLPSASYAGWHQQQSLATRRLGGFERVALWSIGA